MKRNVCLQSTLRQPVRTLFLLLLIGLISFAFIARVAEYLVVNRETDRLAGHYRAIGILEMLNPPTYGMGGSSLHGVTSVELPENVDYDGVNAGLALVAQSQYVDFEDYRRSCSGVLQGLYNADVDGSLILRHVNGVLVYGELRAKSRVPYISGKEEWLEYQFILNVDQVAAGYPEYVQEGSTIRLRYLPENSGDFEAIYDSLEIGGRYFVKAFYHPYYSNGVWQNAYNHLFLEPLNESGLWFFPVELGASVNFTDPALASLTEDLRVMDENQRAMFVTSTKDMSAIPLVQEVSQWYYLAEGRWLDREDDRSGNRVCVVHRDFATLRGLSVGDTIPVKLRELKSRVFPYYILPEQAWGGGEDWGVWQDYETHTETFEIVGLLGTLSESPRTHSTIFMYIPDSCMPAGSGDSQDGVGHYSFVLRSPRDTDAFLAENREALDKLGLRVSIMDNADWEKFQASAAPIRQSAALSAEVFALVLVLALALSAFLYLLQRRRDFAILRSLGVPKGTAILQMLQPMALVGVVGVSMGGIPSWRYALGKASETLASLQGPRGVEPSAALSIVWLAGLCAGIFALLLLFTAMGTLGTARRPVLELLQGAGRAVGRRKPDAVREHPERTAAGTRPSSTGAVLSLGAAPAPVVKSGSAQVSRYVLRHICRAPLKSILTVMVALCFTLALGWMSWTMEQNEAELDRLYRNTQVEAEIIRSYSSSFVDGGFIRSRTVDTILDSGFVMRRPYLEAAAEAPLVAAMGEGGVQNDARETSDIALRAFDQPERFFSTRQSDITVEYADGWDESLFAKDWPREQDSPVLLPNRMMAQLRLQPGDTLLIYSSTSGAAGSFVVAGQYRGRVGSGRNDEPILLPTSALKLLEGDKLLYAVAKFVLDPAKNRQLPEFRTEMDAYFTKMDVGVVDLAFLFWDEVLTQVVEPLEKNLSLMAVLYPVTVAVATLIAAGLAALLLFQAAREAAIMRVLGTTKSRARIMLCAEHLSLCFIGLVLGLTTLIILRQDASAVLTGPALVCAALYLAGAFSGSVTSAISVTNRMPLELLQVKE